MPLPAERRVFISYARKDGAALAQRLQKDLKEQGFDAWLDTQRINGGASWTTEIEARPGRHAEYVLALMSPGSYVSEICRAEQLLALRQGQARHSRAGGEGRRPCLLHLDAQNYRDFTTNSQLRRASRRTPGRHLHAMPRQLCPKPRLRNSRHLLTAPPLAGQLRRAA